MFCVVNWLDDVITVYVNFCVLLLQIVLNAECADIVDEDKVWEYFKEVIAPVVKERQLQNHQSSRNIGNLLLEFSEAAASISEVNNSVIYTR